MQILADACNRTIPKLDCAANNISNIHTAGYKTERVNYPVDQPESVKEGTLVDPYIFVDYSQGTLEATGNSLDLAIEGEGFFVIQTKEGEAYTRKGTFTLNRNNEVVTQNGDYLLGESGKIALTGSDVVITAKGEIQVGGNKIGKLKMVNFDKPQALVKTGNGLCIDNGTAGIKLQDKSTVRSGSLERSNVDSIKEMLAMIDIQRTIEIYQKNIQSISEQDKLSTGRIGRLV